MKPTTYIDWDGLKDIPFFYCDTREDEENGRLGEPAQSLDSA